MTTMARVNVATREAVVHLEHRFGRKKLYIFGGAILFVVLVLTVRGIVTRQKPPTPPAPRMLPLRSVPH